MLSNIINSIIALVSLTTAVGVFVHETQTDRAAAIALALPTAAAVTYAVIEKGVKTSESHTHVSHASAPSHINGVRAMTPNVQPRVRDVFGKKLYFSGGDHIGLWPSE